MIDWKCIEGQCPAVMNTKIKSSVLGIAGGGAPSLYELLLEHNKNIYHMRLFKINRLTPNDPYEYMGRTAPLTSKSCILYIYSTNIDTEYFKHALYSPFFALQNAVCFIMLTCLVPALFTFYIQNVLKLKKIIPAPKG